MRDGLVTFVQRFDVVECAVRLSERCALRVFVELSQLHPSALYVHGRIYGADLIRREWELALPTRPKQLEVQHIAVESEIVRHERVRSEEEVRELWDDFLDAPFAAQLFRLDPGDLGDLSGDLLFRVDELAQLRDDAASVGDFDCADFDNLRLQLKV